MKITSNPSLELVKSLLLANELPVSDLNELKPQDFLFCGDAENLFGVIGLEVAGSAALLRSLVVAKECRGQGCGEALVAALESMASDQGVQSIYLLTETAEDFFLRLGYETISRSKAPEAIKSTQQFSSLCPDSATLMSKDLVVTC